LRADLTAAIKGRDELRAAMGVVMKAVNPAGGRADGARVAAEVRRQLGG